MDLSIIVVNWNTRKYLKECLESVLEHTRDMEYEVFVVDNNSDDGSADMVRRNFGTVKLIENKENVGFAKANNQAMKRALGEYILLLNSDTRILDNSIGAAVGFMKRHKDAGACGCRLLNADMSVQVSTGNFPDFFEAIFDLTLTGSFLKKFFVLFKRLFIKLKDYPFEVECIAGAFFLIRAEVIKKTGLLDENFFIFSEDIDWCYRVKKAGWKIFYLPQYKIIHYWGKSSRIISAKMFIELYKAKFKFWKKYYSVFFVILMKCVLFMDTVIKLCLWGALYFFSPAEAGKRMKLNLRLLKNIGRFG